MCKKEKENYIASYYVAAFIVDETKQKAIVVNATRSGIMLGKQEREKYVRKMIKQDDLPEWGTIKQGLDVYRYYVPEYKEFRTEEENKLIFGNGNYKDLADDRYQFVHKVLDNQ